MTPNILLILVDDLGWRDLGCYGSTFYETPHIDRLCAQGMRFTDAYAAAPVCSPTRASILTGKYAATLSLTDWIDWGGFVHPARGKLIDAPYMDHLPLHEWSLAKALRAVGYHAWHVGKWHLGGEAYYPDRHGFENNIGGCAWGLPTYSYRSPWNIPTLVNGAAGEDLTDRLTDEAIRLIHVNDERSFFLNVWHYAVHTPLGAPPELIQKYTAKAQALGLDQQAALVEGAYFPCEHKRDQRITRRTVQGNPVYAAMVEHLDHNIGRLLQALDDAGLDEQTVVIFTSDNGGLATAEGAPTSNVPLTEGKGWTHEGGLRVPLIVRWPGTVAPGSTSNVPVTSPDLYPSILEAAHVLIPAAQQCDGISLLPLLHQTGIVDREAIFWHYPHYGNQGGTPSAAVRSGAYKLIEFFEDRRLELYNLDDDIGETHDLAAKHPNIVVHLHALLADWREQTEASTPAPNLQYLSPS